MSSAQSVLIVGGGIAGITLGLGLKKQGIHAEIVEVSSEWAIPGLGIALLGPTLRALKAVGLIDSCVRAGFGYSPKQRSGFAPFSVNVGHLERLGWAVGETGRCLMS